MANRPDPSAIWNTPTDPASEPGRVARDPALEDADPNHHLWRNGRLWWIAFTVHHGHLQERVRFSLKTDDVAEARRRRDRIFALYEGAAKCRISIRLRSSAERRRRRERRGRRRRSSRQSGGSHVRP